MGWPTHVSNRLSAGVSTDRGPLCTIQVPSLRVCELQQDKLRLEAFEEKALHAACNELKHNGPCVGNVTFSSRETTGNKGRQNIQNNTGYVYEFMMPAQVQI